MEIFDLVNLLFEYFTIPAWNKEDFFDIIQGKEFQRVEDHWGVGNWEETFRLWCAHWFEFTRKRFSY